MMNEMIPSLKRQNSWVIEAGKWADSYFGDAQLFHVIKYRESDNIHYHPQGSL